MRITGGTHRSRALKAPRGSSTRPTSDRVREALFAILAAHAELGGVRVLDLYAGTGALALEALSRGAARATLVERGREALGAIRANVAALRVGGQVEIVAAPVERSASALRGGGFGLVFVDPPYADVASGVALRAVEEVVAAGALAERATLVLEHAPDRKRAEHDEEIGPDIAGLVRRETRRYGDTCLSFYDPAP